MCYWSVLRYIVLSLLLPLMADGRVATKDRDGDINWRYSGWEGACKAVPGMTLAVSCTRLFQAGDFLVQSLTTRWLIGRDYLREMSTNCGVCDGAEAVSRL
jgi:hypothetical protein